jgi:argininosuccinate synthase
MDANLLHISYEGGILEDPDFEPEESMWRMTVSPEKAPAKAQVVELTYRAGDVGAVDGKKLSAAAVLTKLNEIGGKHGVGRLDIVENRYVGMKSRGCYETPGGTMLLKAHRAMESITLDREVLALKDDLAPRYARMIYNGYWFSPERRLLQGLIDASQAPVNGRVRLKLYKGTVMCVGRASPDDSLFDPTIATFEDDAGAHNQADAEGFIRLVLQTAHRREVEARKKGRRTRRRRQQRRSGRARRRELGKLVIIQSIRNAAARLDVALERRDPGSREHHAVSISCLGEPRRDPQRGGSGNKEITNRFDFKA